MKKVMTLGLIFLVINIFGNGLDIAHRYQNAMEAHKIDNNNEKARSILEDVLGDIGSDHPLFQDIYKSYLKYSGVKASDDLQKAMKFTTGRKEEVYCKGYGLVLSKGFHNDGTKSVLVLGDGKRTLEKNSYSVMTEGRWTYQLNTDYRNPVKSEVWINSANDNHYDIQELRNTPRGKGKWRARWKGESFSNSFSTSGNVKEPIPMFMGVDYHAWGTPDLGYRIDFKVGESQKTSSRETTLGHGSILLNGKRLVKKKLASYKTTDFDQKVREYKDCYFVETNINFAGIEIKK